MIAPRFSLLCAGLSLLIVPMAGAQGTGQITGTIKPHQQFRVAPAVKESTRIFFPQINKIYKEREEEAAENLPPPIEIRNPGDNTLVAGNIGNYSAGAPGRMFPGISATGWNPPDPHIAVGPNHVVEI